jgi:hypothetical protein
MSFAISLCSVEQVALSDCEAGEHTREQRRLNVPIYDHENLWETAETIDFWVADSKSVGCRFDSYRAHQINPLRNQCLCGLEGFLPSTSAVAVR